MTHIPGIRNRTTDGISRHPIGEAIGLQLPDDAAFLSHILLDSIRDEAPTDQIDPEIIVTASSLESLKVGLRRLRYNFSRLLVDSTKLISRIYNYRLNLKWFG